MADMEVNGKEIITLEGTNRYFVVGELVKHFKRETVPADSTLCIYRVIGVATDYATGREMVIYQEADGRKKMFCRWKELFFAEVNHDRYPKIKAKYKFTPVKPHPDLSELQK